MDEIIFTRALVAQLRPIFPGLEVETGISIFYSLYFNEDGNIPINQNEKGEPIRGGGTGFEQDILVYERVSGQTSIVPRVAIEVKFSGVTTHDAIVYSEKARRLRNVYPYLRYGFLVGDVPSLPARLVRLGTDFDFIIRTGNPPLQPENEQIITLLKEEIETSRELGLIFHGKANIQLLHRKIILEPEIGVTPKVTSTIINVKNKTIPDEENYFVYENWAAEKKAVIHFGTCSYCNQGQGVHVNAGTQNGRWLGPFASFSSAEKAAKETGKPVRSCRICAPC